MKARREYDQSELVRAIVREFHRAAPADHRRLFAALAGRLAGWLVAEPDDALGQPTGETLIAQAIGSVEAFSRHPTERRYLYACPPGGGDEEPGRGRFPRLAGPRPRPRTTRRPRMTTGRITTPEPVGGLRPHRLIPEVSMSRALRRHHRWRLMKARQFYWAHSRTEPMPAKILASLVDTPKQCQRDCCRSLSKDYGDASLQERRFYAATLVRLNARS